MDSTLCESGTSQRMVNTPTEYYCKYFVFKFNHNSHYCKSYSFLSYPSRTWEDFVPGVKLKKSAICCPVNGANLICFIGFSSDGESQHSGGGFQNFCYF